MRIFAILVLLFSIVIDLRISYTYSFAKEVLSGMFAEATFGVTVTYLVSAILQIIAVVLLAVKKGEKVLLVIGAAVIGIVVYSYFQYVHVRNFVAAGGAIAIYGALLSSYIARINDDAEIAEIRRVQAIYAVIPTLVILLAPVILNGGELYSAVKSYWVNMQLKSEMEQKQREYSVQDLGSQFSSVTGYIEGKHDVMPFKDSLTTYKRLDNEISILLFPQEVSTSDKRDLLGGKDPFIIFTPMSSPDSRKWEHYPYVKVEIDFKEQGYISANNIKSVTVVAHNVQGKWDIKSYWDQSDSTVTYFSETNKSGDNYLQLTLDRNDQEATYTLELTDKIYYY